MRPQGLLMAPRHCFFINVLTWGNSVMRNRTRITMSSLVVLSVLFLRLEGWWCPLDPPPPWLPAVAAWFDLRRIDKERMWFKVEAIIGLELLFMATLKCLLFWVWDDVVTWPLAFVTAAAWASSSIEIYQEWIFQSFFKSIALIIKQKIQFQIFIYLFKIVIFEMNF